MQTVQISHHHNQATTQKSLSALGLSVHELSEIPPAILQTPGAWLRLRGCGVCGSDLEKLRNPSSLPGTVLGHEVVGEILSHNDTLSCALPDTLKQRFALGTRVIVAHHVPCLQCHFCQNNNESMCLAFKGSNIWPGGFAEQIFISQAHLEHTTFVVPEHISDQAASCVEPLACVLKAIRRLGHYTQGHIAVVGLGFIGLLAGQIYRQTGYSITGVDLQANRRELAQHLGATTWTLDPTTTEHFTTALPIKSPIDAVFLTVVNAATLQWAFTHVRPGGSILVFANYADGAGTAEKADTIAAIPLQQLYHQEINLISSYSPSLKDLQASADWVFSGRLNLDPLFTETVGFCELPAAIERYAQGQALKLFVVPPCQP